MTPRSDSPHNPTENPLLSYFIANGGNVIHKWVDYFEIYHNAFRRFIGKPITFVEIGVQNGGSLQMWRQYFGPQAKFIGVDIDPACRKLEEEGYDIWIGDQSDPVFWSDFLAANPEIDIVLDDGGHTMTQQIVTFEALFPALRNGGVFLCEDTHSSYFPAHGGGLGKRETFIEYAKSLVDEQHAWYHAPIAELDKKDLAKQLYSLSFFDSIVVAEKRHKNPPLILARGNEAHVPAPPAMTFLDMRRAFGVPD